MVHPRIGTEGVTVNYSLSPTTFIEATYGRAGNQLAACGPTPSFCNNTAVPTNDISNLNNAGLGGLPLLFPDASVLNKDYYAFSILTEANVPFFDGTRILRAPNFSWGNRIVASANSMGAPPNINFPGFLNINTTQDVVISLTKVMGRHTLKTGFYNSHSLKRENNVQGAADNFGTLNFANDAVGTNPFDTSFGFANAAIGSFSSYAQASRYVEGNFTYNNTEGYIQDNWKVNNKLTLDYGVRFVHAQPQHDSLLQSGNFLPDKWTQSQAPTLYVAGCVNNANPCTGTNRQAMNPVTGQLLGPNSTLAIGTLVPNTGNLTNGLFQSGQGIEKTTYTFPMLNVGPRFGMAYDVTGTQRFVVRGSFGHVLRPAAPRRRPGAGRQSARRIQDHHRAVRAAAEPHQRRPDHHQPAGDHGLPVRREAADVDAVQRRRADAAPLGHVARRVVRRPAQLERSAAVEHQLDRPRDGVPGLDAGSDAGREHHARRHVVRRDESRSRARLPGLQLDGQHQPVLRGLAHVPLDPVLAQSPVQGRPAVRVQRHDPAVRRRPRRAALRPPGGRIVRPPRR